MRVFKTVLVLGFFFMGAIAWGQVEPGSETKGSETKGSETKPAAPQQQETGPALEKYQAHRKRFTEIDGEINSIFANMSVGLRAEKKLQMAQIDQLEAEKIGLVLTILESSVEALRETDSPTRGLLQDVVTYANACQGGNGFRFPIQPDKTLEICNLLVEKGVDSPTIRGVALEAAFWDQDFEECAKHLETLSKTTEEERFNLAVERIKVANESWERELRLRADATTASLPVARFKTSIGIIKIELFEDHAPGAVANFVSLVDDGFYNGLTFFDVRRGQMCRTGSPDNGGAGDAGYKIANEAGNENSRKHFAGSISMVPLGEGRLHSSQFIIAQRPMNEFDGTFTVFGRVIEGMDVFLRIQAPTSGQVGEKIEAVRIENIEILNRRPATVYEPDKILEPTEEEMAEKEMAEKEMAEKEMAEKEMAEKEMAEKPETEEK